MSLFLVSLAVLTLISCGKKEITTNEQAREAFVAAYEKQNAKSGALMDAPLTLLLLLKVCLWFLMELCL